MNLKDDGLRQLPREILEPKKRTVSGLTLCKTHDLRLGPTGGEYSALSAKHDARVFLGYASCAPADVGIKTREFLTQLLFFQH